MVTVDTGRDGEFWRVLFRADTTWDLLKLPDPLEGTRVTLHKEMSPQDYEHFAAKSKESLSRWCRHSDVEVTFCAGPADGGAAPSPTPVREPLTVDAPFQVEHSEDGTHIIAGPSRVSPPVTGMYNRGLTLLDWELGGWGDPRLDLAWVAWTLRFRALPAPCWEALLAGYGRERAQALGLDSAALQALALGQVAGLLARAAGRPAWDEWVRRARWTVDGGR